jgi:hypothetical protein
MKSKFRIQWMGILLLTLPAAFGANQQSWVSSTGSDGNDCTRAHPCATFQGALAKTNTGGAIGVVDPADYGPISTSSGVTIDGGGTAQISVSRSTGAGILNDSPNPVTIRNLVIGCSSITGNLFGVGIYNHGTGMYVENVTISNCDSGITSGSGPISVRNAAIHDVDTGVFAAASNGPITQ